MKNKSTLEATFAVRCTYAEKEKYDQYWRKHGLRSMSELSRFSLNAAIQHDESPLKLCILHENVLIETNLHLDRLSSMLRELIAKSANDNFQLDDALGSKFNTALGDIKAIRKKLS